VQILHKKAEYILSDIYPNALIKKKMIQIMLGNWYPQTGISDTGLFVARHKFVDINKKIP